MTTDELIAHVVTQEIARVPAGDAPFPMRLHAHLWPFVRAAAEHAEVNGQIPEAEGVSKEEDVDRRARPWQYTVRFWMSTANGAELVAEADPEVIHGTGSLPEIIERYGLAMHGQEGFPDDLSLDAGKARLPQLRNNLGRYGSAAMRIEYEAPGPDGEMARYLCQVDVIRLEQ